MWVCAYTKSNGTRQLIATQALKFERVGISLKLTPRAESLAPVFIGKGVELVGSRGYTQALPLC